jgi:WD40 repeat protein
MPRHLCLGFFGLFCSLMLVACGTQPTASPKRTPETNPTVSDPAPGAMLFAPTEFAPSESGVVGADPIVLPVAHVNLIPSQKIDIPSPEEGLVAFVGYEISAPQIGMSKSNVYQHPRTKKWYYALQPNQPVKKDQVIALLDDTQGHYIHVSSIAKLEGARKEYAASLETVKSVRARLDIAKDAQRKGVGTVLEVVSEEANVSRFAAEAEAKKAQISLAEPEVERAADKLAKHEIKAPFDGQVVQILKNSREGVKVNETMFQIINAEQLRVEGSLERQYQSQVSVGMAAQIEPTLYFAAPITEKTFHRNKPITALAVSRNTPKPLILSAAEDNQVFVWDRTQTRLGSWSHPGIVRTISVTGSSVAEPLALTGCDDGYARVFDLKKISGEPLTKFDDRHDGGVKASAFSPDGKFCVTADGVGNIHLFETDTGKRLYRFPHKHNDFVTALYFLPQCRVVSVGKDNTVLTWVVGKDSAAVEPEKTIPRTGEVPTLGVTEDGNHLLVDSSKNNLHIVSLGDGKPERVLTNFIEGSQFRTFATFSPLIGASKQRMILTASNATGEVQLWRTPTATERGSEIAHLKLPQNISTPTVAAFSPMNSITGGFLVVGTKQGEVSLWPTPSEEYLNFRWNGKVTQIDPNVDTTGRNRKISVTFDNNPKDERFRLAPGQTAAIVIRPSLEK